jgi:hypothetical protein
MAQRRLRHTQLRRGLGEAARLRHGLKHRQTSKIVAIHAAAPHIHPMTQCHGAMPITNSVRKNGAGL